ncbi:opacity protein-like surface antigen [Aquimarina sp. MAR_2010_214]|uniref:outer membrane beta-barrel protein n=1 Tax=Aquimarina sp. MAR_2010_214 TaxID=1250026 RepID=UPI000C70AE16|nr:outer membrane beta-barrel protein [Aquimarina sp. MAR_2010_214]PKV49036.1 opacity protein-like surface antigen [Aquimarina sp. MAR_2010_214]
MKQLYLLFLIISISTSAQTLRIETGKSISSFRFEDSQGQNFENFQPISKSFIATGINFEIFESKLDLTLDVIYNSLGSKGSQPTQNNYFEWEADYLGIALGVEYTPFSVGNFEPYLKAALSTDFLIHGNQVINNQVLNLRHLGEFGDATFFYRGSIGIKHPISKNTTISLAYQYINSFALSQVSQGGDSKLYIYANMIGIGLAINLEKQ